MHSFLKTASRRKRFEDALDEEVRFHLEEYAADLVRAGVPQREARRRAQVHFGPREQVKDASCRARGLRVVEELERVVVNVRLAVRTLRKTPLATGAAALSLALAMGANAAIYSLYHQHMLAPLPVTQPERLVNLEAPGPKPGPAFCNDAGGCEEVFSDPMYRDLQRGQDAFTDIAAHHTDRVHLSHGGRSASVWASCVSGSYFSTLGLSPAAERLFDREVDEPIGGHPIAVLGHDFWVSDLAGAPDIVGDTADRRGARHRSGARGRSGPEPAGDTLMPMASLARLNEPVASLAALSASFATGAALLVAVGLYGVLACSVAARTREFGLRLALGADTIELLRLVLWPVARVILAGSAFGSLAAWGVERAARAVLYEVKGLPPIVIGSAVTGLAVVALIAALGPAYRASRIDPGTALRHL